MSSDVQVRLPSVVLLSAGRGSRMPSLTQDKPKSLLPVGERYVLDWIVEALRARCNLPISVVTGHGHEHVVAHLQQRYGTDIPTVYNSRYQDDVNILSVELGVEGLSFPEHGYLIVETDLLLDDQAWDAIVSQMVNEPQRSFWVTHGRYSPSLTGGIVHSDSAGKIDAVEYQPVYDACYDGWPKMLGLLYVGSDQVAEDRRLRQLAIAENIAQYYLCPWQQGVSGLASQVLDVTGCFAQSFNTEDDYKRASAEFLARQQGLLAHKDKIN